MTWLALYASVSLLMAVYLEWNHGDMLDHPFYRVCCAIGFAVLWPAFIALGVWDWMTGRDSDW